MVECIIGCHGGIWRAWMTARDIFVSRVSLLASFAWSLGFSLRREKMGALLAGGLVLRVARSMRGDPTACATHLCAVHALNEECQAKAFTTVHCCRVLLPPAAIHDGLNCPYVTTLRLRTFGRELALATLQRAVNVNFS